MSWVKFARALVVCTLAVVGLLAPRASGQTFTWNGTADGSWSDASNPGPWVGGLVPVSGPGTIVQFNANGAVTYSATNDLSDNPFILNQLNFNTTSSGLVTINNFNPFGFGGTNPGINMTGTGSVLIQNLSAGFVFDTTTPFNIGGTGTGTLTIGGDTDNPVLSGAGNVNVNFATVGNATTPNLRIGNLAAAVGWNGSLNIQSGYVMANRPGGDAIGSSTIISVAAGSTFNLNSNAETFGGIAGAGNIVLGTGNMQFVAPGDRTWTGSISGTGSVDQSGGGVFTLGGSNSYTGNTIVSNGTIRAASANALSAASVVFLTAGGGGVLDLNNFDQTVGGLTGGQPLGGVTLGSATLTLNNTGTRLFNGTISGTGGLTVTGTGTQILTALNSYTGATTVNGGTLQLVGEGLQSSSGVTIGAGAKLDATYTTDTAWNIPLTGTGVFAKSGPGKLTFAAGNPGADLSGLIVNGGSAVLDFSSNNSLKIGTNPALTLVHGGVSILGNNAAATNRTFNGLSLLGAGSLAVTSGNNQNASASVGAISRGVIGAAIDFGLTNTGSGVASISTTTANNGTTGIMGGWATVNGTSWAVSGTGTGPFNVSALPSTGYVSNSLATGANADITSDFVAPAASKPQTIRFNTPVTATLTVAGTNIISTGGILVTPNVGAHDSVITGTVTNALAAPKDQELLIQQFNTAGNLTIGSVLNNTAGTSVSQTAATLGTGATITLPSTAGIVPGMLLTAGTNIPAGLNAHVISVNSPTSITISFNSALKLADGTTQTGPIASTSPVPITFTRGTYVTKSGPGTLVLTGTNTFTGSLVLNEGVVSAGVIGNLGQSSVNGSSSIIFNGGTLRMTGNIGPGNSIQPWIIGPAGGTVDVPDANTAASKQGNSVFGTGMLTKTGAGVFSVGSNVAAFSGLIDIKEGIIRLTSNQLRNSNGITVEDGAQYYVLDTNNGPYSVAANASLILNGDGPGGMGAYRHSLDEVGSQNGDGFSSPVILQTTSRLNVSTQGTISNRVPGDTITDLFTAPISGPGSLIKDGDGGLVLSSATNKYGGANGSTIVSNGFIRINGGDNRLPVNTTLQLGENGSTNAGTFDLNGFNQTVAGLVTAGSAGVNHQIVNGSSSGTISTLTVNYNGATPQVFDGLIGGFSGTNIGLVKGGTGTLTLTANSAYSGPTTVNAGKLRVFSNSVPRPYVIADGASLDVVNTDPSNAFQMSSLTLGSTSASGLTLELTAATLPSNGVINVTDTDGLVANGKVNVVFSSVQTLTLGQIPLIKYNGNLGGAGFGAFSGGTLSLPSRVTGSLVNNTANSSIDLNVTGVDFLKWNGNLGADWNINTTQNFKLASNSSPTTYLENPAPGDTVVFDDTAAGTKVVNLTTALRPSNVTVNSTAAYTFSGPGKLSGPTGLVKSGSGTLTVLTNNDNTGATTINEGTLSVGNGGTTGALGAGNIINNAALIYNRSDNTTLASAVSGTGTFTKAGTNTLTVTGGFSPSGDTTIAGGALALNGGGNVAGRILGPGTLVKDGVGTLNLTGDAAPGGGTIVNGGILQIGNNGSTGTLAGNVSLGEGTTLSFNRGSDSTFAGGISGAGTVETIGSGKILLTGPLSYTGATNIGTNTLEFGSATDFTVAGRVSGSGNLIKSGAGQVTLLANNTAFTGTLTVNQGTVMLADIGGSGGDFNASTIVINPTGKFIFGQGVAGENPDFPENANGTFIEIAGGEFEQRIGEVWAGTRLHSGVYHFSAAVGTTANATSGPFTGFVMESGTVINDAPTGNATVSLGTGVPAIVKTTPGTVNVVGRVVFNSAAPISLDDGVLAFDATNVTTGTSTVTMGSPSAGTTGTLRMTGPGAGTSSRPFDIISGAFDVTDPNGTLTITTPFGNSGPLAKTGPGTLVVTPSGNYSGTTTVQAGTLRLNPGNAGGEFHVSSGGNLAVAPGVNSDTTSMPRLTLDSGSNVTFELSASGNPASPLINVNDPNGNGLTLNGATHLLSIVNGNTQPLSVGQFTLIDYDGTPITSGFSFGTLPARAQASLIYNTANTSIDVNIQGTDSTLWNGNLSADWDLGTVADVGGTKNFRLFSNSNPTNFITGDRITFDDTATGTTTVNLTTALQPASVLVNNDTKNYIFQGPGSITGSTGLIKQGQGSLTIATDNTYTGLTSVSAGTLQVGNGGTTGSVTGPIFVENGANLTYNRSDASAYNGQLSGTGTINKNGAGVLTLGGISPFTGTVNVNQGTLLMEDTGGGADLFATSIVVNNGGNFTFGATGNPDLPDTTIVTVNQGGVFELRQGENFGGINLLGGTFSMTGTTLAGVNPTGAAAGGYNFESGNITTSFSGASTGGFLSGTTTLNKTTPGIVTIDGGVKFGAGLTVNVREGVIAMPAVSFFSEAGTPVITLGDSSGTSGTIRITDAGVGASSRTFDIAAGGATIDTAVAGGTVSISGDITDSGTLTKTGPGTLNISSAATFTGPAVVNGGTLGVSGSLANSSLVTVNATGTYSAGSTQKLKALTINSGGLVKIATGAAKVLTVGDNTTGAPLTLTSGKLDLTTNGLVVDVADGSQGAALQSIRSKIVAGYNATGTGNNGDFNGNGITSSNASADRSKAVGYALASEVTTGPDFKFMGQSVDASSVVARYTLAGDATLDGIVDFNDLVKLAQNYNTTVSASSDSWWNRGDFTYDGVTDFNDLVKLAQNYNTAVPSAPIPGAGVGFDADLARAFASVPEPSVLAGAGLSLAYSLSRRKRR